VRIKLAGLCLVVAAGVAEGQKTDSVWFRNGDRITGEVKSLFRARLKYSTDDLGTIYIEWDKIVRISSHATFEVQLGSGDKYYGILGLARDGSVVVGADTLALAEVVTITPIKRKVLSRLSGYLDLGFSYQKANKTLQLTSAGRVMYRGPLAETVLDLSTFREDRDDASETARLTAGLTERLRIGDRWSTGLAFGYNRNEELDLAGRGTFLAFGSRTLARSNHNDFWITGGLVLTRERYFSTDSSVAGVEALVGASFAAFRYDRPKLDASVTSQAYPSLSIQGRVRWQNDLRVSYELAKDFMLTTTLFGSYDNKPLSEGAPKNDFGTTLAISWTF
jgi:hypothetical protein